MRCSYQLIASHSSCSAGIIRANARVSALRSSGGSWYWSVGMAEWWHVIELGDGETSPGAWDLRPLAERIPGPGHGRRACLDIGTAACFRGFELERRGAAEVTATDQGTQFAQRSRRN